MTTRRQQALRWTVLAIWALLGLSVLPWLLPEGDSSLPYVALAFVLGPLLLPLRGLWLARRYTYRWAPLALAPVMLVALTEFVANAASRGYALASSILAFAALAAIVAALRAGAVQCEQQDPGLKAARAPASPGES